MGGLVAVILGSLVVLAACRAPEAAPSAAGPARRPRPRAGAVPQRPVRAGAAPQRPVRAGAVPRRRPRRRGGSRSR